MNLGKVNWIRDDKKKKAKALLLPPLPPKTQNIILALGSQKCIQSEMIVRSERSEVVTPRATNTSVTSTRVVDSSV